MSNILFLVSLFSFFSVFNSFPKSINIGVIASTLTNQGSLYIDGTHQISAIAMALAEINNKHDGVNDDLLPNTQLKFALRTSQRNFLGGLEAAQDLSTVVFDGKGVKAIIGAANDEVSRASGQVLGLGKTKINQIDFASAGSFLSHADLYPYYSRVNQVDAYGGRVIARLIKSNYGWQNINLFSTADTYGTDIALEFHDESIKQGINIENYYNFFPGTTDFSDLITTVKARGVLKVFVFLMKASDAGVLLEQGYNAGLFGEGTQIFGTRYMYTTAMFKYMSPKAPIGAIMNGLIGIDSPYINRTHDGYRGFVKRFISQNSTKITNIDGSVRCSNVTDDDGDSYLYQVVQANSAVHCTGLDYSTFLADGSDIAPTAFMAYDAVIALAIALDNLIYKQNNVNFTADDLRDAIRTKVNFLGASGLVYFKNGRPKSQGYGLGDRLNGLMYKIYNFNSALNSFRTVGFYSPDADSLQDCDMSYDITCSKPVYNTKDGLLVTDTPNIVEEQMPQTIRTVLLVAASIALAIVAWFTFILVLYMDDRIMKSAQPNMLLMMLFGGFLGGIRIILATLDLTDTVCIVGKWFGHLAFVFVFGAMIVKTWRMGKVINSGFAKVKVTQADANRIFWGFIFCICLYLMFDTIFGKPHRAYEESFDGHNTLRLIKCKNVEENFTSALFAIEGLMLAYGAHLCWSTKEVAGAVNDSGLISLSLFVILFVCALTFPIVYLHITPTPVILMTIMATAFFIAVCGCIIIMFAPKTTLIFSGAHIDENLKVVQFDRNAENSSSSTGSNVISQLKNKIWKRAKDKYDPSMRSDAAQSVDNQQGNNNNNNNNNNTNNTATGVQGQGQGHGHGQEEYEVKTPLILGVLSRDGYASNKGGGGRGRGGVRDGKVSDSKSSGHSSDDYKMMIDYSALKCDDESMLDVNMSVKSSSSMSKYESKPQWSSSTGGKALYPQGGSGNGSSSGIGGYIMSEDKSGKVSMISLAEPEGECEGCI
eukprot:gene10118-21086_t